HDVAVVRRQQIDTGEVCPDRRRGCAGKHARGRRDARTAVRAPEADVGPPLFGRGDPLFGADDLAYRDENANVVAGGWHESLDEGASAPKPRTGGDVLEDAAEPVEGLAAVDVAAPAAEARLDHDGRFERRQRLRGAH